MLQIKLLLLFLLSTSVFCPSSLYSQWSRLPDLPVTGQVFDMYFVNYNTGWMTMISPFSVIKTTDGGNNWIIQNQNMNIRNIQFIDSLTGYANGFVGTTGTIWKTIDGGDNWNSLFVTGNSYADIFYVNKDTGWTCGFNGIFGGVWRTTNGGNNWQLQYTSNSNGLDRIFFLKDKVNGEYVGWTYKIPPALFKTTNSGVNWTRINNSFTSQCGGSSDIYFIDTARGVLTRNSSCINTTTDGGYNWNTINEPNGSFKISMVNDSVGWISMFSDTIIKTTNFFQTYGKQPLPTLSRYIFAVDTSVVYGAFNPTNVIKTTNGGGPIIYTGIDSLNTVIPSSFILHQNYPNPFNPSTTILFSLSHNSIASLTIYNMLGKEVLKIYDNQILSTGNYRSVIDFTTLNLSSGVYFYKLNVTGKNSNILYSQTKKMIYSK